MPLTHFPASASSQDVVTALKADGACIIDELAPAEVMDRIAAEMEPYLERTPARSTERLTRRTGSLIARSKAVRELVLNELILEIAGTVLDKSKVIQLSATQIISVLPGEGLMWLHRDEEMWERYPFSVEYETLCATMWALTDFTAENGATRVLPGTHRLPPGTTSDEATAKFAEEQAVMSRGSAMLFSGKIFHGAGANKSDSVRRGLAIDYCPGWLRQEENQFLATPLEVAKTLDRKLLGLMGYQQSGTMLGYFGDVEDPMTAVFGQGMAASTTG